MINYSGRLLDTEGEPVTTPTSAVFTFYDAESGGTVLAGYAYHVEVTPNDDGLYAVSIGDASTGTGGPVPAAIFDSEAVWLNVNLGGEDLAPRARIATVGYAFRADEATTASAATTASVALLAANAAHADHASTANHAQSADSATNAAAAAEAVHAESADSATTSTFAHNANHAESSDIATEAQHAATADHANFADHASLATRALGLSGSAFITASSTGTAVQNGQALLAAYQQAKTLTPNQQPLSATNRATLLIPPARYDLGAQALTLDAEFVDITGLSTARANQTIVGTSNGNGTGVLMQTVNDVRIENLTIECTNAGGTAEPTSTSPAAYFPTSPTTKTRITNCEFKASDNGAWSMRVAFEYAGTYINVVGGHYAFGGDGIASGTFTDCTGGDCAFGGNSVMLGVSGQASGTFTRCKAGSLSFGGLSLTPSSTARFSYCEANGLSFYMDPEKSLHCILNGMPWPPPSYYMSQ